MTKATKQPVIDFTAQDLIVGVTEFRDAFKLTVEDYRKKDGTINYREAYQDIDRCQRSTSYASMETAKWDSKTDRLAIVQRTFEGLIADQSEDETVRSERRALGNKMRKATIKAITQALEELFPDFTFNFSRTAGCSCGCSPGWKMRSRSTGTSSKGLIIWVTILCPPAK